MNERTALPGDLMTCQTGGEGRVSSEALLRELLRWSWLKFESVVVHTTGKGKSKICVQAMAGKQFWVHWKRSESMKIALRASGGWLVKMGPGQWEVLVGVTARNYRTIAEVTGIPVEQLRPEVPSEVVECGEVVPEVVPGEQENPF